MWCQVAKILSLKIKAPKGLFSFALLLESGRVLKNKSMALYTKCILKDKDPKDGLRISIMSRHTLNDGKTPDRRITSDSFDLHYPELAPSPKLIGDYYKRGLLWNEFEILFVEEKLDVAVLKKLEEISATALLENVTLLCIEESADQCHRRLIADICSQLQPALVVEHH
jgi:uncharacterized protein YeaO (DUF488 family)